jgi:hypothetical protein
VTGDIPFFALYLHILPLKILFVNWFFPHPRYPAETAVTVRGKDRTGAARTKKAAVSRRLSISSFGSF